MDINNIVEYITPYLKGIKFVKKNDGILVYNDKLICMNEEASIMYVTNIMSTGNVICNTKEKIENKNYMSYRLYNFIIDKYRYLSEYANRMNIICEMDNMEMDEVFVDLLKLKAKDPVHKYILDNIYLPVFYGYLPINKADTLSVKGGLLEDNTILIKYTVYKKKLKSNIDIYLRLLPLL